MPFNNIKSMVAWYHNTKHVVQNPHVQLQETFEAHEALKMLLCLALILVNRVFSSTPPFLTPYFSSPSSLVYKEVDKCIKMQRQQQIRRPRVSKHDFSMREKVWASDLYQTLVCLQPAFEERTVLNGLSTVMQICHLKTSRVRI